MAEQQEAVKWACPAPGCCKLFNELWRLRQHYRTPPSTGAREGGHGEELLRCPRCKELLPTPKQGRHRCKAASRAASTVAAAVSAAVAAAAEQAAEEEEEGDRKEGRDEQWVPPAAKRRRRIPGRRVRFTLPDSDSEGGSGGSDSEAAADPDGQAAQGLESPQLLPAEALKEHPTPRGAAAAKLLVGMKKGQAPPAVPAAFVPAPARRSAPAPPAAAVAGGEAAGTGIRWWQVAVKPELAAAAASAPAALPPPPPPQVPPPAASPWQQHLLQPPLLMHMQQPPALAATALLGELLHLLKLVMPAEDAEQFVGLVVQQQAQANTAAAAAASQGPGAEVAVDALLVPLAADLGVRCAAVRQLLTEPTGAAELAEAVQCAVQAHKLQQALGSLTAILMAQQAQPRPPQQVQAAQAQAQQVQADG